MDHVKYKKLEYVWYKRLEKSGFFDLETDDHKYLKRWDCSYFQMRYEPDYFKRKQRHYRLASMLLYRYPYTGFYVGTLYPSPFRNDFSRKAWELHSQGDSLKTIATKLKSKSCIINFIIVELKRYLDDYLYEYEENEINEYAT